MNSIQNRIPPPRDSKFMRYRNVIQMLCASAPEKGFPAPPHSLPEDLHPCVDLVYQASYDLKDVPRFCADFSCTTLGTVSHCACNRVGGAERGTQPRH